MMWCKILRRVLLVRGRYRFKLWDARNAGRASQRLFAGQRRGHPEHRQAGDAHQHSNTDLLVLPLRNRSGCDIVSGRLSVRWRGLMVTFGQASGAIDPIAPVLLSQKGSVFLTRPFALPLHRATRCARRFRERAVQAGGFRKVTH
jgi:hypothetical protein